MGFINDRELLERKIEESIKKSYSEGEYLRCYNLLKLMFKVNKNNSVLKKYIDKFPDSRVKKLRRKWGLYHFGILSYIINILKSPSIYVSVFLLWIFGGLK